MGAMAFFLFNFFPILNSYHAINGENFNGIKSMKSNCDEINSHKFIRREVGIKCKWMPRRISVEENLWRNIQVMVSVNGIAVTIIESSHWYIHFCFMIEDNN